MCAGCLMRVVCSAVLRWWLFVVCLLCLFAVCDLLSDVCCVFDVWCLVFVACCLLFVVCVLFVNCLLFAVCCLFGVCCLLFWC